MTLTAVFLILAVIALALALHSFITYPLSLAVLKYLRPKQKIMPTAPSAERFAICMCAYNEEQVIEDKIQNLLALREQEPDLEIRVYVDAASDRTAQLLQPYADRIHLHVATRRHGKTHGMNLLVAQCEAPLIVFTDANVMLATDALQRLRHYFADPQIGCVCGNLTYTNGEESVTAATGSLYWRLEEAIKLLEQASGSVMGADGSLFAIRRELHHAPPDHIIDDMYVSFRILCDGYRLVQARDVKAFERSGTSSPEEFQRKIRIACQAFNVHRLLWPLIRKTDALTIYKYVSHKLLRWLSIYFLALAGVFAELSLIAAELFTAAIVLPLLAVLVIWLGWRWRLTPFAQVTELLSSLAGAGLGLWKSWMGERFQTWQPSASVRKAG
ncbi:MAG: glycosyltransferase [Steroidobacteraceae bacterium]